MGKKINPNPMKERVCVLLTMSESVLEMGSRTITRLTLSRYCQGVYLYTENISFKEFFLRD